jgi:glutathione S-transferase
MRVLHRSYANYALVRLHAASDGLVMELFILPMSCSLAAHVALLEAGIEPTLREVSADHQLADGTSYLAIAPKGAVPAVRLPDGTLLTESSAVLQYIADQAPDKQLAPAHGTRDRYLLAEWLNFISTEVHKKLAYLVFSSQTSAEIKAWARTHGAAPLAFVERHLSTRDFLMGTRFTVADTYLFWALLILPSGGVPLAAYPNLAAFVSRIRQRPSVVDALRIEVPMFKARSAANADLVAKATASA